MPKIGLLKPRYNVITMGTDNSGNETESYGVIKVFAKAVSANTSINTAKAKFFADDGLDCAVNEFINGSVTIVSNDLENSVLADITGAVLDSESGDVDFSDNDSAPYIRYGFIVRRYKGTASQYRGIVFHKILFDIPADDYETKGESIVFKADTVTGEILRNINHKWKSISEWLDSAEDVDTWLNEKMTPSNAG